MSGRELCSECDGSGEQDWLTGQRCYVCRGTGLEPEDCPDCDGRGFDEVYAGYGTVAEVTCTTCRGSGQKGEADAPDPKREGKDQQKETAA